MVMLQANGISKRFGGIVALSNVSIEVRENSVFGLIGPNGAGKTTLLNIINGFLKPDKGDVIFKGVKIISKRPSEIAKMGIGRSFQIPRFFPNLSVIENLTVTGVDENKAKDILAFFNLDKNANEISKSLSYGQKKSLDIARALSLNPSIMLLDEPFAGLDFSFMKKMLTYIENLNKEYKKTLIIVEHHLEELMSITDNIGLMNFGQIVAIGRPEEIKKSEIIKNVYFGEI